MKGTVPARGGKRLQKRALWALASLFFLLLAALPLMAHAMESPALTGATDVPGLVSLAYDDSIRAVRGVFEHEGTPILIETRRGRPISRIEHKMDPSAPRYEIDICLMDQQGTPFFVQVGGDGPIDRGWPFSFDPALQGAAQPSAEDSRRTFRSAQVMLESLKKVAFRPELTPERDALLAALPLITASLMPESALESFEGSLLSGTECTDRHRIEIWKKKAFLLKGLRADHSGTVAMVISPTGTITRVWSACNHGTCPGGSGMRKKCTSTIANRCGFTEPAPNCATPYGFSSGTHTCNDDTYIQYYRIKYDTAPSTTGGTCSDSKLRKYAPRCW